jgi:anthranilate synthase component 1
VSAPRPGRAEFEDLAGRYPIVPVWREVFADLHTPLRAYAGMSRSLRDSFLLESVEGGERWGRYSFIGGDSLACVKGRDGAVSVEGSPPVAPEPREPPLAYLRRLMLSCRAPAIAGLPPLHGGAVGYLGYDCVRELERLPPAPSDDLGLPDLVLLLTRSFVVFDHFAQRLFVISNVPTYVDTDRAYERAVQRCDEVVSTLHDEVGRAPSALEAPERVEFAGPVSDEEFASWVELSRKHIYAGDIFQVVPSRRFEVELKSSAVDAYRLLRTLNPSPYMYLLRFGAGGGHPAFDIVGSSPEPLVRVTGERIEARPIAGTRARGATREYDVALEQELLSDEKERAEHVMLVDLARNDVGRVARYGTVRVEELMAVERYSHVMHLVSSVVANLSSSASAFDALTSCFPAGTVTGAPKVRAMEIIDSLEETRRGPYAGVVGYFDFSGNIDTCITIRTMVATGGRAYVQAGAGIVADSVPRSEVEETRRKAEVLLRAAGAQPAADARPLGAQPS